ncbi:MAG TPA: WD40 repeat domain-containing protein [Phototrophicaceae bacterium]|nr:WD40 repeat domain-containing protein [Phototrophicaceae bacterium]
MPTRLITHRILAFIALLLTLMIVLVQPPTTAAQPTAPIARLELGVRLFDIAWSPDSQLLAVGATTGVKIYTNTLQEVTELHGHTDAVTAVAWSPDGQRLASGGGYQDGTLHIWNYDAETMVFSEETAMTLGVNYRIAAAAWSPDGTKLAILVIIHPTGEYGEMYVWDTATWQPVYEKHRSFLNPIRALGWNASGTKLVVGSEQGILVFDIQTGLWLSLTPTEFKPQDAVWYTPDHFAIAMGELILVDGTTGQVRSLWDFPSYAYRLEADASGNRILIGSLDDVNIVNPDNGAILKSFKFTRPLWEFDWNADATVLATVTDSENSIIEIWDTSHLPDVSGTPTATLLPTLTPTPTRTPTPSPTPTTAPKTG